MPHGAAKTSESIRAGLVAMAGLFIDIHIICTMTAFFILSTGIISTDDDAVMIANAFESAMSDYGRFILALILFLFAISTMISYSYYSLECSRYLFGKIFGNHFIYIYLALIPIAALWSQTTIINIINTVFDLIAIPAFISSLSRSPKVIAASKKYFAHL